MAPAPPGSDAEVLRAKGGSRDPRGEGQPAYPGRVRPPLAAIRRRRESQSSDEGAVFVLAGTGRGRSRDMVDGARGEKKARGRNRITGNLSVRSRPLAPPQHHPRIAIAGDIPPRSCKSSGRQIDYTEAGAASTPGPGGER